MNLPGEPETAAGAGIQIRGSRLVLRALRPEEIEDQWQAMVTADPMAIAELPDEAGFKARLRRSGQLVDGWLDLAIDLEGAPTDPANVAMRTVFERAGWALAGSVAEYGRQWLVYRITRAEWAAR